MKGSIRFDNEINVEVAVDPSQDEGAKLLSAVNLVDGQALSPGGGGGIENVTLVVTNGRTSGSISLHDYFEQGYPSIINNTLQAVYPEEILIEAQASYTLNIALSSLPTEVIMGFNDDRPIGSGNVLVTWDEEIGQFKLSISGDCAITIMPVG